MKRTLLTGSLLLLSLIMLHAGGSPYINYVHPVDPTCFGDSTGTITISALGGSGAPYTYSIDNGATYQSNNIFTGLPAGNYQVKIKDVNNVSNSGSQAVTLTTPPEVLITNLNVVQDTCGLGSGKLDFTATGGDGGPYTYSIDNGGSFQASGTYTGLNSGTYHLLVQDSTGCQADTQIVLNKLGPSITSVPIDQASCGLNNASYYLNTSGGVGTLSYSNDNGLTYQANSEFTNQAPGTYYLVVQDSLGCTDSTSVLVINTGSGTPPTINQIIAIDPTCGQLNGYIAIGATGGAPPYNYSFDGGLSFDTDSFQGNVPGVTFPIQVEDGNGCITDTTVSLNPSVAINDSVIQYGYQPGVELDTLIALATGVSYQWYLCKFGDFTPVAGATNDTFIGEAYNSYLVVLTDTGGTCVDTSACYSVLGTGIEELSQTLNFSLYPNPTTGAVTLSLSKGGTGPAQVTVTNTLGQVVQQLTLNGTDQAELDLHDAGAGVYFVTVQTETGRAVRKLVVE